MNSRNFHYRARIDFIYLRRAMGERRFSRISVGAPCNFYYFYALHIFRVSQKICVLLLVSRRSMLHTQPMAVIGRA